MKCPNCNSTMFVADKTTEGKSLVTFSRCTTCVGEHVSSELTNDDSHYPARRLEFFKSAAVKKNRYIQML
jgi:DNA-directed RNA polymerase subunit M/transcription elongation factor TFIIS